MRGSDKNFSSVFSYVDIEQRAPEKHPLRVIKGIRLGSVLNNS